MSWLARLRPRRPTRETAPYLACAILAILLIAISAPRISRWFQSDSKASSASVAAPSSSSSSTVPRGVKYNISHPTQGKWEPDSTKLSDCGANDLTCYEQAFANLGYTEGPHKALAEFADVMKTNAFVNANCHPIAHYIGFGSLTRYKGDVPRAFGEGAPTCWSGYYHGILQRAFMNVQSPKGLVRISRSLCSDPQIRKSTWLLYQCVHGIGHGLMIFSGYSLPFALEICHRLQTKWDQQACTGGVFMENIVSTFGTKSPWLRDNDPVFPCREVRAFDKPYCYLMVTSRVLQLYPGNWRKIVSVCRTVEKNYVVSCFSSMGRDASGNTAQNPRGVISICALAGRWHWGDCVYGAARDFTATFANGNRAATLCNMLPRSMRPVCFWHVGTILGTMQRTQAERHTACAAITSAYLKDCFQGASTAKTIKA
jgi:hypothetical protein